MLKVVFWESSADQFGWLKKTTFLEMDDQAPDLNTSEKKQFLYVFEQF